MKNTKMKKLVGILLMLAMLIGMLPTVVSAVNAGDVYAADTAAWGTQGNHGWYYMYKAPDGTYHELPFFDGTAAIDWQKNNFALDPAAAGEMLFLNHNTAFVGELGSRPVYAFKAPASGEIELTTQTHSTEQIHMQVYVGSRLQKINGEDSLTLTTTGTLEGGMTKTTLTMRVTAGDMVYVEFYSTDIAAMRQLWINEYSVKYLSVEEDLQGTVYAPDMGEWGTQGNHGWYFMYQDVSGNLHEMDFYDDTAAIDWQKNNFASDPYTAGEMYFISQNAFFLGEGGTLPVYAFKAVSGGEIELSFQTHGTSDLFAKVYVGNEAQQIGSSDRVVFSTDGTLEGGFTETKLTLNVKKNTMVCIIPGSSDPGLANRSGYLRNLSVKYLSTNDEVDYTSTVYTPDMNAWGTQGNNGWYYMYQDGNTGAYGNLNFYDDTAAIDWQKNHFAFDPNTMGEMLFVDQTHFFTGECGSKPVYAFKAPISGEVQVTFEVHGLSSMGVSAYVGDKLVPINGEDRYSFTTTGPLVGAHTAVSLTAKLAKDEMLYLVCSSTDPANRDGWFRNPSAKYLSVSEDVDYLGMTLTPDPSQWGADTNNCWSYQYRDVSGAYHPMAFYPAADTNIDWQKDAYASDPFTMGEMFFISQNSFFLGENGSRPAYVFTAPIGGEVAFTVHTHGVSQVFMEVYKNGELVLVNGQNKITFTTTGTLPGAFTEQKFTVNVKKGTKVILLGGTEDLATQRSGYVNSYAAKYLSVNDEVEEPEVITVPKVEGPALVWNKTTDYYTKLQEKLASSEPMTWLFVGDSITANDGDVSKGYRSYVEIFESYLKSTLGRKNDRVINTAVSGWKIRNINFQRDIAQYDPDVVYVKIGTNDSFVNDFAANSFLQSMSALYDQIIDSGAIPVVACANGFSDLWGNTEQTAQFAQRYPDTIRTLAYEKKLLLVDYFSAYGADMDHSGSHYFNPDTIHPNRNGMLFLAQTLLADLDMAKGGAIMTQNAGDLAACEVSPILIPDVSMADFLTDGTNCKFADVDLTKSFLLAGGATAVGADETLITFRSLAQYLNNNHQLGRNITLYCTKDGFAIADYPVSQALATLILMPEAYGASGEALFAGATGPEIAAMVKQATDAGMKAVLITPAPDAAHSEETAALAEAVLAAARDQGVPVIDLFGYMNAVMEAEPAAKGAYFTDNRLNFAGTNEAAILIGTALGQNVVKISDNRYMEDHTPENWGKQAVNGFRYLYMDKQTGKYIPLPFVTKDTADAAWTADRFSLAADQFTFIGKDVLHASTAYSPVKAFTAPESGTVVVTLKHRRGVADTTEGGTNGTMWIKAFLNETALSFDGGESAVRMLAAAGCYHENTVTVQVKKGDVIYVVVEAEQAGQADLLETVTYVAMTKEAEAPVILEGDKQTVEAGAEQDMVFRSSADVSTFVKVLVNGAAMDPSNYTVTENGTTVTLKASYVKTLRAGTYTIDIVSTTGTATATFTVTDAPAPTGDTAFVPLMLLLLMLCGAGIVILFTMKKRILF